MNTVSRGTNPVLSLEELLKEFKGAFESVFGSRPLDEISCKNVHVSLLPYFFLSLSCLKSKRYVVSIRNFQDRQVLFEALSSIRPGSVLSLSSSPPSSAFTGADLHNLNSFHRGEGSFLLVSPSLMSRVRFSLGGGPKSKKLSLLSRNELICLFKEWGFELSRRVDSPGSYCVRGAVIDFYLYGGPEPIRSEFDGEKLVSVRSFDLLTQKKLRSLDVDGVQIFPPLNLSKETKHDVLSPLDCFGFLSVEPSLSPYLFDVGPIFQPSFEIKDLACVSHPGFIGNQAVFDQLLVQLTNKEVSQRVLFCGGAHNSFVRRDSSLASFTISNHPFSGGVSSSVLGVFWVSLDSFHGLPKAPSVSSPVIAQPKVQAELSTLPWLGHVVHEGLGIALYRGLSAVSKNGSRQECVALEFKHGDLVHVPLDRLDFITSYVGDTKNVPLSDLRSSRWAKAKQRARRAAGEIIEQFVQLYGERDKAKGFSFSPNGGMVDGLSESFPYSETKDQLSCLEEVFGDMENVKPMDRLLVGDVGLGKTEVAIRAAVKAVSDGRQVLLLAPTTILANQLFNSFSSRLSSHGIEVRHFSRFTPQKQAKKTLEAVSAGIVDIVIGTHRLLTKGITVKNLGLIIIDEEHRFGAKQKEFLRGFRSNIDVLSMSATPIPRTLQFSLVGIRDISTMKTPPPGRLPIITSLNVFESHLIKSAIEYEIGRGGQVFFVHSNVFEINKLKKRIQGLIPNLKIGLAHGRVGAEQLESVMLQMVRGDLDLLLSTTIIEAGIDLPNVNTILINNAHKYGLAQLYQMRGRVGRSSEQGYCYLLLPREDVGEEAQERLRTILYNSELGSGYDVALRDLEIRGGGNLFGLEQSGHLAAVGFHLYNKIVCDAAKKRNGDDDRSDKKLGQKLAISVDGDTLIPEKYVGEPDDRLYFYRLLATADSLNQVLAIEEELCDRFGPMPNEVVNLLCVKRINLSLGDKPVEKIVVSKTGASIIFSPNHDVVNSLSLVLGGTKPEEAPFSVVTGPGGETSLSLPASSTTDALLTIQYSFESRCSPL